MFRRRRLEREALWRELDARPVRPGKIDVALGASKVMSGRAGFTIRELRRMVRRPTTGG